MRAPFKTTARVVLGGLGVAAVGYATLAAVAWWRYGQAPSAEGAAEDPLLDGFLPAYDVVERHHVAVAAPAALTLAAAKAQNLTRSPIVQAIFKTRALVMGATPVGMPPRGLLEQVLSMGWGVLADTPDEIVIGAVTRPWEADVKFRALAPDAFAGFHEPGYVKIIWSLRADPVSPHASVFRTETRALATDPLARTKFRRYWALSSPGIALIRLLSLAPLKADAERRWNAGAPGV